MQLNDTFIDEINKLLPSKEAAKIIDSISSQDPVISVRLNSFKGFKPIAELEPVPWCPYGAYLNTRPQFTFSPLFHAGSYYVQDASSMFIHHVIKNIVKTPVTYLDLCAAPGGKTTTALQALPTGSTVVANEIVPTRAQILKENVIKWGTANCMVTCDSPKTIGTLKNAFDVIAADVPCSGEGMFRKSGAMITAWEQNGNDKFIDIQKSILKEAVKMLKPGGSILYSTCTFDPGEDEKQVLYLKELFPGLRIEPIDSYDGFVPGNPEWAESEDESLKNTYHLFPHKIKGEGHFVALLKSYEESDRCPTVSDYSIKAYKNNIPEIEDFLSHVNIDKDYAYEFRNNKLYMVPKNSPELSGKRIMRRGVYLGELKKNRFEPSQSFAMILGENDFDNKISFSADDPRVYKYLKGETLDLSDYSGLNKGWVLILVDKYPLGFGKLTGDSLKNKYLPGWRMMS